MEDRPTRPGTLGFPTMGNLSLSRLAALIDISIGDAHTILYSIEDISRLAEFVPSPPRTRVAGYPESRGPISGDDLSRKLLGLEQKVKENCTSLKDLQRANLRGLQLILEDTEELLIMELHSKIRANFETSKDIRQLAESSPDLLHISTSDLEAVLPPTVNVKSLISRLSQVRDEWDLPFPNHGGRLSLCNSAKLLNSGTNKGVLQHVQLRDVDKQALKRRGGTFLFWKCDLCDFRVRYHTVQSNTADIEKTEDTRTPGKGHLTLRTVFLAKSHLHMQPRQSLRFACLFCIGNGKRLEEGSTAFAKEADLADHIDECHDPGSLPQLFMKKMYIASADEKPKGRYDVQFHRTRSAL